MLQRALVFGGEVDFLLTSKAIDVSPANGVKSGAINEQLFAVAVMEQRGICDATFCEDKEA